MRNPFAKRAHLRRVTGSSPVPTANTSRRDHKNVSNSTQVEVSNEEISIQGRTLPNEDRE